jgi:hypothetical protein
MVDDDFHNEIYNCQCCKINRDGILCCHVLKVMTSIGAPDHYIFRRWCQHPPDIVVSDAMAQEKPTGKKLSPKDMKLLRYGNLSNEFSKLDVGF